MAFIHGFRASELLGLRLSDIDLAGRQLYIRRLKNGFSTCHPLLPDEYNVLKSWLRARKYLEKGADGDWLFLSLRRHPLSRQQFFYILREAGRLAEFLIQKVKSFALSYPLRFAPSTRGHRLLLIEVIHITIQKLRKICLVQPAHVMTIFVLPAKYCFKSKNGK